MKKIFTWAAAVLFFSLAANAQQTTPSPKDDSTYTFTVTKELKCTPVKNQNRSSTCWSFASVAFLESELLRTGKGEYDLSEMFIVRHNFEIKADKYVRMHGDIAFSPGGLSENVFAIFNEKGIVPESVYDGLNYGDTLHVHNELDAVTTGYIKALISNRSKKLSPVWKSGFSGILDAYLGKLPEKFTYNGKEYTPKTFAQSLGLNMDDYVSITSFTHHPFYSQFILEIPDNYFWGMSYNLPLDEMMAVIDSSIEKGYTVSWGADVSETGFEYRKGFAVVPDENAMTDQSGSDQAKWEAASGGKKDDKKEQKKPEPAKEKAITQELRQEGFDSYETQDDHGMLIMGTAKDQNGNPYYKVKNSWGTKNSKYDGYFFASVPYVAYKTTCIFVHKDAIPTNIAKKMGLKK